MAPQNLALVGYRGTGKSTIASLVARSLGWQAIDADLLLENRAGMSIAEIFATQGENHFRDLEETILGELVGQSQAVIATGGGVVLREENRRNLSRCGAVIWLHATADELLARIAHDEQTASRRPPLTKLSQQAEISRLLQERQGLYKEVATNTVDTNGKSPDQVAAEILDTLFPNRGTAG